MKIHRFFVVQNIEKGKDLLLTNPDQVHQIRKVFRMEKGDIVTLFNGKGTEYVSSIKDFDKEKIVFEIKVEKEIIKVEKEINVFLACIRKERFEWATEKLTELGVMSITPIITERSDHTHLNIERLKKIAIEASEQCGRGDIPAIAEVINLQNSVFNEDNSEVIVADFGGMPIKDLKIVNCKLNIFIGPEGGWTEAERELFGSKNAKFVSLGNTTLRAETAAIIATGLLLNL